MKTHTFIAFVTIVLLSVSCGYSNSQKKLDNQVNTESGIIFFDGSLEEALKLSATTNKPIMMDVATSWCSYCKKMKKYTFFTSITSIISNHPPMISLLFQQPAIS